MPLYAQLKPGSRGLDGFDDTVGSPGAHPHFPTGLGDGLVVEAVDLVGLVAE